MSILRDYEGVWFYEPIDAPKIDEIKRICELNCFASLVVMNTCFNFGYAGRDPGRWVEEFLQKIAQEIVNASGNILCRTDHDDLADPYFEYYTVNNGVLYRQRGDIVRREPERV